MIGSPATTPGAEFERRRTERLLLRRPVLDDLDWMTTLHSDPLNYEHSPDRAHAPHQARSLSRSLVEAWEADRIGYWVAEPATTIEGLPEGRIGMAGVRPSSLAGRPCFNLYFRFVLAVRGRGFAAEASREALSVAALIDPSCPVVVRTRASNVPAHRLADAIGLIRRPDLDALTTGYVVYVSDW
jgi:RimJ/RimL family protein N-acetyltransferase